MFKNKFINLSYILKDNLLTTIVIIAVLLSLISVYRYTFVEYINLAYFDANTRLNIARRIFDNLTPGIAQIGNVWPPLPQLFMLPFVVDDNLWRSGLAGWIVSGISYVFSAFFMYKIIMLLTKNSIMSFFFSLTLILNINLFYLQSTAMSESFFLTTLLAIFYFMTLYLQQKNIIYLIPAAIATFLSTLSRYEGYSILVAGALIVFLSHILWKSPRNKLESNFLIFVVPASCGVILWSLYLWTIFGDPFFWLHYYADTATPSSITPTSSRSFTIGTLIQSFSSYIIATINMTGLITALFGFAAFVYVILSRSIKKEIKLLLLFPLFILIFMTLTLSKNTVILQPNYTFENIMNKKTNLMPEFNSRYGLSFLPYLIIFCAILISKNKFMFIPFLGLIALQTTAYFWTPIYFTYQLPLSVRYGITPYTAWLHDNNEGGLILISAAHHDPEMIQLRLPYKQYIHEGTQHYWKESLNNPARYATWVVLDRKKTGDPITKKFQKTKLENFGFSLVINDNGIEVYHINNK